jgi:hypothetical protein
MEDMLARKDAEANQTRYSYWCSKHARHYLGYPEFIAAADGNGFVIDTSEMYCPAANDVQDCPMTQQIETHYWWDDIKKNVVAGKAMMLADVKDQRSEL